MRKFTAVILAGTILLSLFGSCVSLQDRPVTTQEMTSMSNLGTVTTQFTTYRFLHFISNNRVKNKAYTQLLTEARKQYGNEVDVKNIRIKGGFSGAEIIMLAAFPVGIAIDIATDFRWFGIPMAVGMHVNTLSHIEKITATGEIVRYETVVSTANTNLQRLEVALSKAATTLIDALPRGATIAILNVYSNEQDMTAYVIDELEFILVEARRFAIVDRRRLEQIRAEQNFQMSGDVSDDTAVSIGNMLGATIVINGDISSVGASQRLVLRALDVRTAQIIAMARESFLNVNG